MVQTDGCPYHHEALWPDCPHCDREVEKMVSVFVEARRTVRPIVKRELQAERRPMPDIVFRRT